ncbi:hypothetical protein PMAYCL1PPCAC_24304, partial [Pristionchus mayeri]
MTPFDIFLILATAHVPILSITYIVTTFIVLKNPRNFGGRKCALLFTVRCILDLIIICSNFVCHRLPVFSFSAHFFPTRYLRPLFRITLAMTYSLPYIHDALSLKLLHNEIPPRTLRVCKFSMETLDMHFLLSSFIALFIFLVSHSTPISISISSFPFLDAHFFIPHSSFSLLPPAPLPFFLILSTVLSTISIGLISHRTLSSRYHDGPSQRGPLVLREDRWTQSLQRIQRNINCIHCANLLYIAFQLPNLRSGYSLHLPAGLYLNGFIIELKIFSTLLMFMYDNTKLSTALQRIL